MNIKVCVLFIFYLCLFQVFLGADSSSTLVKINFMAIADTNEIDIRYLSIGGDFELHRFVGKPCQKIGRVPSLERCGLSGNFLVSVESFVFSNGQKRYVGVLPQGSIIYKLPSCESDTFGYKCEKGSVVYIPLSAEQTSIQHQNF